MIFYECGGGAEEKILSFKLSSANGTQGKFYGGRYWGAIQSNAQAYVPLAKNGTQPVYTNGATRVIHIRFRIDSGTGTRDLAGCRYGATYWACMPTFGLSAQDNEWFCYSGFSSDGKNTAISLKVSKQDIPFATNVWYDAECGWDKDTKEIYLEVWDELGHHKKVTDTLNTLYQYSTDYEYAVGIINRNSGTYSSNITFDLWNTWYEENHSTLVWGVKGG